MPTTAEETKELFMEAVDLVGLDEATKLFRHYTEKFGYVEHVAAYHTRLRAS